MDEFYKEVVAFQRRVNDYIDDLNITAGRSLQQEVQRLEDDVQTRKNPRSIEDRVKQIMRNLEHAAEAGAMSPGHADELKDQSEEFRRILQKLM